jgi:Organic Anion Transporter Polypeptide (OATP) family
MNNIVGAVFFICLANLWQGLASGVFGSAVSTLEKRFDMSSSQSSLIASGYEIGPIPVILVLMILGKRSVKEQINIP